MNFNDKKTRRIISIVVLVVIVAMVATMIIPYMMAQNKPERMQRIRWREEDAGE